MQFKGALLFCSASAVSAESYKAGVVLYKIIPSGGGATPPEQMKLNVDQYQKLMETYKDKVDIMVFPEYGLTTLEIISRQEPHLVAYGNQVQTVGTQACDPNSKSTISRLACAAQKNDIYIIVNLLEREKGKYYVTNVGLDRNGIICLRCRKQRLFKGVSFTKAPAEDKPCVFTAKFKAVDVTFSAMFDTDMLYPIPDEIKNENVIMTSSITNSLPLEFSVSLEAGFAVANKVNLIVSSLSDTPRSFGGSGIYLKNGTSVVAMNAEGVPDAINGSTVLIRDVQSDSQKVFVAEGFGKIVPWDLAYKKIDALTNTSKKVTMVCLDDKNLCCSFSAELEQDSIFPYSWVATSNKTTIMDQTVEVFICALVKPKPGTNSLKFKKVTISSSLRRSKVNQSLPISLRKDFIPASFKYVENESGTSITLNEEAELLTFGIVHVIPQKVAGAGTEE